MKKFLEYNIQIDEIVNYQEKLAFIIDDSPFKCSTGTNFGDIGYIGKYRINDVRFIYNSKFHITDFDYYYFNELNITQKKINAKIDIKNRIKLNNLLIIVKNIKKIIKEANPFLKIDYFLGKEDSYLIIENRKKVLNKETLILLLNKHLFSSFNLTFVITSIIEFEEQIFIYFKLPEYFICSNTLFESNKKEETFNYGILNKYNFMRLFDNFYYDVNSNIDFCYYILDNYVYYIMYNIKDKEKKERVNKELSFNKKNYNLQFDDELVNSSFEFIKFLNFEKGLNVYQKLYNIIKI